MPTSRKVVSAASSVDQRASMRETNVVPVARLRAVSPGRVSAGRSFPMSFPCSDLCGRITGKSQILCEILVRSGLARL